MRRMQPAGMARVSLSYRNFALAPIVIFRCKRVEQAFTPALPLLNFPASAAEVNGGRVGSGCPLTGYSENEQSNPLSS